MLRELLLKTRSCRRFDESRPVPPELLRELVELTRWIPSANNAQALRYRLVSAPEEREKVFPTLRWATALPGWHGPEAGQRPTAYIVLLCDLQLGRDRRYDDGIAAQTLLLGAAERGYGGCMLGLVDRPVLAKALGIDPQRYQVDLVVALGVPAEEIRLTEAGRDGDVTYYRDGQVHCVPKRPLDALIV